jgi:hypothetical protein
MAAFGRYCCKSRKLQGHEFFAKTRNGRRSPIRMTSIALPKSPVSLTQGDEVPHILTRKPHLQPAEFLITSAKRLLQQYRPEPAVRRNAAMRPLSEANPTLGFTAHECTLQGLAQNAPPRGGTLTIRLSMWHIPAISCAILSALIRTLPLLVMPASVTIPLATDTETPSGAAE